MKLKKKKSLRISVQNVDAWPFFSWSFVSHNLSASTLKETGKKQSCFAIGGYARIQKYFTWTLNCIRLRNAQIRLRRFSWQITRGRSRKMRLFFLNFLFHLIPNGLVRGGCFCINTGDSGNAHSLLRSSSCLVGPNELDCRFSPAPFLFER